MSELTAAWVFKIAGLGRDGLTSSNSTERERIEAMALSTAGPTAQPAASVCDEWQPYIIPGSIRMGEMSYGPITAKTASSSLTLDIQVTDDRPEIGRFFLAPQRVARPILEMDQGDTLTETEVSAVFNPIDDASASFSSLGVQEGSILYNGREALRVESVTEGTNTITFFDAIPALSGSGAQQKTIAGAALRRGQIGTYIESHTTREDGDTPPFVDSRWFDANPFVSGREVTLLRYQGDSAAEVVWWRGVIDGEPTLSNDGTKITLKCVDIMQALKNATIGSRLAQGDASPVRVVRASDDAEFLELLVRKPAQSNSEDRLYNTNILFRGVVYQVDRSVIAGVVNTTIRATDEARITVHSVPHAFGGDPPDVVSYFESRPRTTKINELLVSDPLDADSPAATKPLINANQHPLYCSDLPDREDLTSTTTGVVDHPVLIALGLMGGLTLPNLPDHWKALVPTEFIAKDTFVSMAYDHYSEIEEWPGMVAGKDGKPVKFWEFITEELLNGLGIGLALGDPADGEGGQITVKSLFAGNENIRDSVTLSHLNSGRGATIQTRLAADSLIVQSGQGIGDKPRFTSESSELFRSRFFPYDAGNVELKTPGLVHPNEESPPEDFSSTPSVEFVSGLYRQYASLLRSPLVTVRRTVTADRLLYPGQWVLVTNKGGIVGSTGLRDTSEAATALAIVINVTPDLGRALDQTVEMYLLPFGLSRIGPAGEVASGTSNTVTLQTDEFLGLTSPYEPTDAISVDADSETFEVDQKVLLVSESLEKQTQVETITGISGNVVTIDGSWTAVGGGAYSPQSGDVLTLADHGDSNSAEQSVYAFVSKDEWML